MSTIGKMEELDSTFQWKIEKFSSLNGITGIPKYSPMFSISHPSANQLQWKLLLYPAGVNEENQDYMGLFLQFFSECQVTINYSFYALDDERNEILTFDLGKRSTYKKEESWGTNQFCPIILIFDESTKALVNDTLTLCCTIAVKSTSLDKLLEDADGQTKNHFENLFENGKLSDVTFKIEQREMYLHKIIVTSLSPVFFAMFEHNLQEKNESVVRINDVRYHIMKELFRYIYVRKVYGIENIARDLLVAADKYDVQGLKLLCESTLVEDLNMNNALELLVFALEHNTTVLKAKTIEFVVSRLERFVGLPEFTLMHSSYKDELLREIAKNKVIYIS